MIQFLWHAIQWLWVCHTCFWIVCNYQTVGPVGETEFYCQHSCIISTLHTPLTCVQMYSPFFCQQTPPIRPQSSLRLASQKIFGTVVCNIEKCKWKCRGLFFVINGNGSDLKSQRDVFIFIRKWESVNVKFKQTEVLRYFPVKANHPPHLI